MVCQNVARNDVAQIFQIKASLTARRLQLTTRRVHRIERAKELVCGVVAKTSLSELNRDFENVFPPLEELLQFLISGALDAEGDEVLKGLANTLQGYNVKISQILEGSVRIGLEAIEPFPQLLAALRTKQERLQSQIEGILLSLDDSFQETVAKSASELSR
jgi:hypothetical protein